MSELIVPGSPDMPAKRLVVMGIRDKSSLGMSAAEAWLGADPENQVVATTFSPRSHDFVEQQSDVHGGRIDQVTVDWSDPQAYKFLREWIKTTYGTDRQFAGLVHSIARADADSFKLPAHEIDPQIYLDAFVVSALSLQQGVLAVREVLAPGAGIVTYGFGDSGKINEGYGGPMSVAKSALSHWSKVLADSLGDPNDGPSVRMLEIITGYIESRSGKGVALAQPDRARPADVSRQFNRSSPLRGSSGEQQRIKAGRIAVAFMNPNSDFSQTTGDTIHIDGGWSLRGQSMSPPRI